MEINAADATFMQHLHEEKLRTQDARTKYVTQKLAFVTGLMSLGSLGIGGEFTDFDFGNLLLLAPWVATAFDLYILGEDYSVKRIGAFLRSQSSSAAERTWEAWVTKHRDRFAPVAMPLLTTTVLIASVAIMTALGDASAQPQLRVGQAYTWVWYGATLCACWFLYFYYRHLKKQVETWTVGLKTDG